jgi:hypothetical protein
MELTHDALIVVCRALGYQAKALELKERTKAEHLHYLKLKALLTKIESELFDC